MPQTNEVILEKLQAGIESTRGTNVAATRKVYAKAVGSYDRELISGEDSTGTFAADRRGSYQVPDVGFTFEADATFEDQAWWNLSCLKGGVTGVTDGGSPPAYTYTSKPTITSDDLAAFTLEHGEPGLVYESAQVMVDEWSIKIDPDNEGAWKFSATGMGVDWAASSYTGTISERTTENIPAPGTLLYIDSATIGSTLISNKIISATITGKNNIHFKKFMENVATKAKDRVGRGKLEFNAEIVFEHDTDGEFLNFRVASANPVQRFVRLESSNTTAIHDAVFKRARIDLNGFWSSWSPGDRDGNKIYTLNLKGFYDVTSTYMLQMAIVNALSALA